MPEDFIREMEDDDSVIKDVTLVGSDGGRVSATKRVLAIRSPVFRQMFNGNFQESREDCDSVQLNYPAQVLRTVVSYCSTNIIDLTYYFEDGDKLYSHTHSDSSAVALKKLRRVVASFAVALVQLRDAANYLEMYELHESVSYIFRDKNLFRYAPCFVLQELMNRGDTGGKIWKNCMEFLKEAPGTVLYMAGISRTSFPLLEIICRCMEDNIEDLKGLHMAHIVAILNAWSKTHPFATEEQRSKLRKYADELDLQKIEIQDLSRIVPCPLFPLKRLSGLFFVKNEFRFGEAYTFVKILKAWSRRWDLVAEEDRSKLRTMADKIDLESIPMGVLVTIKPCPLFPAERLRNALMGACLIIAHTLAMRNSARQ